MRGKIRNRKYATQVRDFTGLRYGTITPTDIDGFTDFGDKIFIFIETKYKNAELPYGQKLHLQRLVDAIQQSGRHALGIVAEHEHVEEDIDVANCKVREIRWEEQWIGIDNKHTVRKTMDKLLERYAPMYLKHPVNVF